MQPLFSNPRIIGPEDCGLGTAIELRGAKFAWASRLSGHGPCETAVSADGPLEDAAGDGFPEVTR
jgi:hypothetical protein